MDRRTKPIAALGLAALLSACGESPPPLDPDLTAFENAQVWTGDPEQLFESRTLYVRGEEIVDGANFTPGEIVDLEGAFVIPPLGEAHNHNLDQPAGALAVSTLYMNDGIFYVKNPNSTATFGRPARERVNTPETVDAIFSMGGITITGGHPQGLYVNTLRNLPAYRGWDADRFNGEAFHLADAPADVEDAVSALMAHEPDFVKTYLLFTENFEARLEDDSAEGYRGLAPEVFIDVVDAVKAEGLRVSTHVETAYDLDLAVSAGVDEVNHLPGYFWATGYGRDDYLISDETIAKAANAGTVIVTTTVITAQFYSNNPERREEVQAVQLENLQRLIEGGVTLAIGSDNYFGTSRSEAENLVAIGVPTKDVLKAWIETPKTSIFPERNVSCLTPGCEASFIAMSNDPSTDLSALDTITFRMKDGIPLD